jgi:hypothetical protein
MQLLESSIYRPLFPTPFCLTARRKVHIYQGHEKANADRPKPLAVDQNISTGNNYSQHNSGSQRENHGHVDRNSQGRHGSPHRSFVHKETEDFVFFFILSKYSSITRNFLQPY